MCVIKSIVLKKMYLEDIENSQRLQIKANKFAFKFI